MQYNDLGTVTSSGSYTRKSHRNSSDGERWECSASATPESTVPSKEESAGSSTNFQGPKASQRNIRSRKENQIRASSAAADGWELDNSGIQEENRGQTQSDSFIQRSEQFASQNTAGSTNGTGSIRSDRDRSATNSNRSHESSSDSTNSSVSSTHSSPVSRDKVPTVGIHGISSSTAPETSIAPTNSENGKENDEGSPHNLTEQETTGSDECNRRVRKGTGGVTSDNNGAKNSRLSDSGTSQPNQGDSSSGSAESMTSGLINTAETSNGREENASSTGSTAMDDVEKKNEDASIEGNDKQSGKGVGCRTSAYSGVGPTDESPAGIPEEIEEMAPSLEEGDGSGPEPGPFSQASSLDSNSEDRGRRPARPVILGTTLTIMTVVICVLIVVAAVLPGLSQSN